MTLCDNCGYEWDYGGELPLTTCPSCGDKTSTGEESPFAEAFLSLAGEMRKYAADADDDDVAQAYEHAADRIESELPDSVTKE